MIKRLDWNVIREYMKKDLLIMQIHPTKDLFILNYSKTCQYERAWDEVTLSCRGLVINGRGDIVGKCMKKFFNKEEHEAYDDLPTIPTNLPFEVFEKMDGSLISIFHYENEWIIASRGSFMSDQSNWAKEVLNKEVLNYFNKKYTYVHELIVPQNKIVVNYGDRNELVLLTAINNESGNELSYNDLLKYEKFITIVKRYDGLKDFDKMKALNTDNKEGFVILFTNGFRMKVKFEEYCRLHAIVTNVSNKIVWEHLRDGKSFENMLNKVPDEFYDWVVKTKKELEDAYKEIERECYKIHNEISIEMGNLDVNTKKDFALRALKFKYSNILFLIYYDKDYSEAIWKLAKPKYKKPF